MLLQLVCGMTTWWERLNDPLTNISNYSAEARSWRRCAVGESSRRAPSVVVTTGGIPPEDKKLERLGVKFYNAVRTNNRPRAKQLYLMIERRVIRLMQESL